MKFICLNIKGTVHLKIINTYCMSPLFVHPDSFSVSCRVLDTSDVSTVRRDNVTQLDELRQRTEDRHVSVISE